MLSTSTYDTSVADTQAELDDPGQRPAAEANLEGSA
jgi:hypothetical protein